MAEPKDPWSDDQLQSTPGAGPPDKAPWKLTFIVTAILALLMLGGYFLWHRGRETMAPASPPATLR